MQQIVQPTGTVRQVLFIAQSGVTPIGALTAASFTSASYHRSGSLPVAITLSDLSQLTNTTTEGGIKEVASVAHSGLYVINLPAAAIAPGAPWVVISLRSASCDPVDILIQLDADAAMRAGTNYRNQS